MLNRAALRKKAASNNPSVAFPAMEKLGWIQKVAPSVDTGYRRFGPGGRLFLPAVTNVIPDPQGVLADGTFWPVSTAHTAITANQAPPIPLPDELANEGVTKCLKFVNDGTADTTETAVLTVTVSKAYQASLYIYAPALTGVLTITTQATGASTVATVSAVNAGWVRYNVAHTTGAAETTLHFHLAFATGGATVYVTGAMLAREDLLTPFFCGASNDCAWSGTANASASTRPRTNLQYALTQHGSDVLASNSGTIVFQATPLGPTVTAWYIGLNHTASANNGVVCYVNGGTSVFYVYGATAAKSAQPGQVLTAGVPWVMTGRWSSDIVDERATVTDLRSATGLAGGAFVGPMVIGSIILSGTTLDDTKFACGYMNSVLFSPERKADAWVEAVSPDGASLPNPMQIVMDFMDPGDMFVPLVSDSVAYQKTATARGRRTIDSYVCPYTLQSMAVTVPNGRSVLSMRFDDGPSRDYTFLFPLLQARGLVAGFSTIANRIVNYAGSTTLAQLLGMQAAGMEIMCHSMTHKATDPVSNADFRNETVGAGDYMRSLGLNVVSFVQPGSWTGVSPLNHYKLNSATFYGTPNDNLLMAGFSAYEAYIVATDRTIPVPAANRKGANQTTLDTLTLAAAKTWVDGITGGVCRESLDHMASIGSGGGNMSDTDFTALLDYIAAKRDAGAFNVLTPTQQLFATYV
jgi:hypothetical protein